MSSSRTHSGNKKPLKTRVCLGCKLVYKSRKGNPSCPRCHRRHHTRKVWSGLLAQNKKKFEKNYSYGWKLVLKVWLQVVRSL